MHLRAFTCHSFQKRNPHFLFSAKTGHVNAVGGGMVAKHAAVHEHDGGMGCLLLVWWWLNVLSQVAFPIAYLRITFGG